MKGVLFFVACLAVILLADGMDRVRHEKIAAGEPKVAPFAWIWPAAIVIVALSPLLALCALLSRVLGLDAARRRRAAERKNRP